jgi:hypothetical protein
MHVPSYRRLAPALFLALAAFAGGAQAVDFDEKLKAPQVKGASEIKSMAENYSAAFSLLEAASPAESVTNRSLYLDYFEVKWQINRALDEKRPLQDLSAVGLVKQDDGSLSIDLGANPQWDPLPQKLSTLLPAMSLQNLGPLLINRGFRERDLAALKSYLATNDLNASMKAKTLPMAISFSRVVKKFDRLKLPVNHGLVFSYLYQRSKAEAQEEQRWAEGLLNTLDAQPARILQSYLSEMKGKANWAASDVDSGVAGLLSAMRLPDFERRATDEARGVAP